MSAKKILVTGVGGYWGGCVARRLAENSAYHVLGLDTIAPKEPIPGLDFIQADIRNPLLVELLKSEQIQMVCHLAFEESVRPTESAFDHNVMGTMKVLGACAESAVNNIIMMSSTAVYGAKASNSGYLPEEAPLAGSRDFGTIRDLMEIEAFCNGFRRQNPGKGLTILRFANIIGPKVESMMTRFLREPFSPSLMGFDPMMQLVHEDDVLNVLVHVVEKDYPGVFNVGAQDLMPLSKVIGLSGKLRFPVLHPFAYWGYSMIGGSGLRLSKHTPIELDYLRYRWVGDLRKMREVLQYEIKVSAEESLEEFAEKCRVKTYVPEAITRAYEVDLLKRIIEKRNQSRDTLENSSESVETNSDMDGDKNE